MIYRYPLNDKVNVIELTDNSTNFRVLISPTDGKINLYADVTAGNGKKFTFLVLTTGRQETGNLIGSVYHGNYVYHVYDTTDIQPVAVLENCLVFDYPDSSDGSLVTRCVFDAVLDGDDLEGYDSSRGDYRHFKLNKIVGGIKVEVRSK